MHGKFQRRGGQPRSVIARLNPLLWTTAFTNSCKKSVLSRLLLHLLPASHVLLLLLLCQRRPVCSNHGTAKAHLATIQHTLVRVEALKKSAILHLAAAHCGKFYCCCSASVGPCAAIMALPRHTWPSYSTNWHNKTAKIQPITTYVATLDLCISTLVYCCALPTHQTLLAHQAAAAPARITHATAAATAAALPL